MPQIKLDNIPGFLPYTIPSKIVHIVSCPLCGGALGKCSCFDFQPEYRPVGWTCPSCRRVNAPSVPVCPCSDRPYFDSPRWWETPPLAPEFIC